MFYKALKKILILAHAFLLLASLMGCLSDDKEQTLVRIGTYNLQNFFDDFDDPRKADDPPIPEKRIEQIASVITTINCDVLVVQEIENIEMLEMLNRDYLNHMYDYELLIEGNDPRGIDVGVLSKIELHEIKSYKDYEIRDEQTDQVIKFSRDLLSVELLMPDGKTWTLFTTHLKSGVDKESQKKRTVQTEAIAKIIRDENLISRWGRGYVIVAGDFNAEPWSDDLEALISIPMSDPARDKPRWYTHSSGKILDYILLSPDADLHYVVGSVNAYREFPAKSASDHFPVYLDLMF